MKTKRTRVAERWNAEPRLLTRQARRWRARPAAALAIVGAAALVSGCSRVVPAPRTPEPTFLRASPIIEHGVSMSEAELSAREATDTADDAASRENVSDDSDEVAPGLDEDAATPRVPAARRTAPAPPESPPSSPPTVIARANAVASQAPESEGFLNAVMTYTYLPGAIFQVYAAPNNVTDLVLEPGEQLMGEPAAGDTLRWRLGVGSSAVAGVAQKHVFIKPTRAGLATNLTINTDRRTYFLKLESLETDFMFAVQWSYPQSQALAPLAAAPSAARTRLSAADASAPADVSTLNFDYGIEVVSGKPRWRPQAVYDDGQKTFIRFDPSILHGESPALYVIERGEMQIVNYRVKKNLYVVDRIFELAELRLGQEDQDVVRLRNRRAPGRKEPRQRLQTGRSPTLARPGTPASSD